MSHSETYYDIIMIIIVTIKGFNGFTMYSIV